MLEAIASRLEAIDCIIMVLYRKSDPDVSNHLQAQMCIKEPFDLCQSNVFLLREQIVLMHRDAFLCTESKESPSKEQNRSKDKEKNR